MENEYKFTPTLNPKSQWMIENSSKGRTFEEWNWIEVNNKIHNKELSENYLDANCTFKPALQTKKKGHSKYLNFLNPDESEI